MTRWHLETSAQFDRAARKLDRQVLRRIRAYLKDVCDLEDPRARGKTLHRRVDPDALRRAVERSTRASAALECRSVPPDHVRSEQVERFLAARRRV